MTRISILLIGVAAIVSGCTSAPTNYTATLSTQDPKWQSPGCQKIRAEAAKYKEQGVSWGAGALLGPYGLALAAAGKEHQEKKRILLAREMHLQCSSKPLPRNLQVDPAMMFRSTTKERRGG